MFLDEKLTNKFKLLKSAPIFFEDNLVEQSRLNFIQVYADGLPYFRASLKGHNLILKNYLEEMNVPFRLFDPHLKNVPFVKGDYYELVGLGIISKSYSLDKESKEYTSKYLIDYSSSDNTYFDYRPEFGVECSYEEYRYINPNKQHFLEIIEYFDKGLVFLENSFLEEILAEEDDESI